MHILGSLNRQPAGSSEAGKGVEAIAVWEVAVVTASPSGSAQQPQQSSSNQPLGSGHLQLVGCQSLASQADVVHVLASTETGVHLIVGSSNGVLQHMSLDWSRGNVRVNADGTLEGKGAPYAGTSYF